MSEWSEKSTGQKLAYYLLAPWRLIGSLLQGAFIGLLIASGIWYFAFDASGSTSYMIVGAVLGAAVGFFVWLKELNGDTRA